MIEAIIVVLDRKRANPEEGDLYVASDKLEAPLIREAREEQLQAKAEMIERLTTSEDARKGDEGVEGTV